MTAGPSWRQGRSLRPQRRGQSRRWLLVPAWLLLLGLALMVLGVLTFADPDAAPTILLIVVGLWLVNQAATSLRGALDRQRPVTAAQRAVLVAVAVVCTAGLGFLVLGDLDGTRIVTLLLGASLAVGAVGAAAARQGGAAVLNALGAVVFLFVPSLAEWLVTALLGLVLLAAGGTYVLFGLVVLGLGTLASRVARGRATEPGASRTVQGDVVRGEVVRGEVVRGEVVRGEVVRDD